MSFESRKTLQAKRVIVTCAAVVGLVTFVGVSSSSGQSFPYAPTTLKLIDPPTPGPVVTPAPIVVDPAPIKSKVVENVPASIVANVGAEVAGIQVVPAADPGLTPQKVQVAGEQIESSPISLTGSNAGPGLAVGIGLTVAGIAVMAVSRRRKSA